MNHARSGWAGGVFASLLMAAFVIGGPAHAASQPAPTYVGANTCGTCHLGEHEGWIQTAHRQIVMPGSSEGSYINDADGSGRSDFFDPGLIPVTSLPGGEAFDQFGANAPELGRNNNIGAFVKIGQTLATRAGPR